MRNRQYWCVLVTVVAVAVGMFAVQRARASGGENEKTMEVKIDNFTFSPKTLTVAPGTTVKWTNRDDIPHTVVSDDKVTFKSKVLDTDDSFSFTFSKPGTYDYFCSLHPHMTAKVVVQ